MRTVIVLQEEKKCLQHHIFLAITYVSTNMAQWYFTVYFNDQTQVEMNQAILWSIGLYLMHLKSTHSKLKSRNHFLSIYEKVSYSTLPQETHLHSHQIRITEIKYHKKMFSYAL